MIKLSPHSDWSPVNVTPPSQSIMAAGRCRGDGGPFPPPQPAVMGGAVPRCPPCGGVVKPDIVFFGEELPPLFMKSLTDLPLADLLVVMGTSLEVRCMLGNIRGPVRLEINREPFGLPRTQKQKKKSERFQEAEEEEE
ncbi:unnamed protein product [Menidia menidia]|uniref:(Atlantic silverside) hypothetical protein n=1 Tax=Menidia menidia TaxID=238744 RepID=A0A8S4AAZ7_9TELE|nr:unnamed protein product [Menidia menidia]